MEYLEFAEKNNKILRLRYKDYEYNIGSISEFVYGQLSLPAYFYLAKIETVTNPNRISEHKKLWNSNDFINNYTFEIKKDNKTVYYGLSKKPKNQLNEYLEETIKFPSFHFILITNDCLDQNSAENFITELIENEEFSFDNRDIPNGFAVIRASGMGSREALNGYGYLDIMLPQ